jgi:hypothetical protein
MRRSVLTGVLCLVSAAFLAAMMYIARWEERRTELVAITAGTQALSFRTNVPPAIDPFKSPDATPPVDDLPPSRIVVGPFVFQIHYRTAKTMPNQYGYTSMFEEKILLRRDLGFGQRRETLWHELEHCAIFLSHSTNNDGFEDEDEFIEANAPTLVTVLRDNPQLTKWLAKRP